MFKGEDIEVLDVESFDWIQVQFVFFLVGGSVFEKYVFLVVDVGCVVIDNMFQFCYEFDILLVVFEVNVYVLVDFCNCNIIVNLNCLIIQMLVVLKLLYEVFGIECINVCIYQLVLGVGKFVFEELVM